MSGRDRRCVARARRRAPRGRRRRPCRRRPAGRAARSPRPGGSRCRGRAARRTGAPPRPSPRPRRCRCRSGRSARARGPPPRPPRPTRATIASPPGIAKASTSADGRELRDVVERRPLRPRADPGELARRSTSGRRRPAGAACRRALASSHDVPTSGWPASGSSTVGREDPQRARGARRRRTRSRRSRGRRRRPGGRRAAIAAAVEEDAERVAALAVGAEEDAERVQGGHGIQRASAARRGTNERIGAAAISSAACSTRAGCSILDAVAREGSMTAAATALGYTQSAVSQAIARARAEAGTRAAASAARAACGRPRPARSLARHAARAARAARARRRRPRRRTVGVRAGRLRLAAFPSAGSVLVPPAVAAFRAAHPDVELAPRRRRARRGRRRACATAASTSRSSSSTTSSRCWTRPGSCCTPLRRRRDARRAPARPPAAAADDVVADGRAGRRDVDLERRPDVQPPARRTAPRAAGFTPQVAFASDDYGAVGRLVLAGVGVALVPELAAPVGRRRRRAAPARAAARARASASRCRAAPLGGGGRDARPAHVCARSIHFVRTGARQRLNASSSASGPLARRRASRGARR